MKSDRSSVSQWIASLKAGEMEAVEKLWDRYKVKLVALANRRLAKIPKRAADEEDIAQSVFLSLCRGAAAGRLEDVRSRDELWWLLLALTRRKTVDMVRRETAKKRGGGRVQTEAGLGARGASLPAFSLDDLIGSQPTPDVLVILDEQYHHLLGLLPDIRMRKIAVSRIEGYTVREIADELSVTTRSIERKLKIIRETWSKELIRAS